MGFRNIYFDYNEWMVVWAIPSTSKVKMFNYKKLYKLYGLVEEFLELIIGANISI